MSYITPFLIFCPLSIETEDKKRLKQEALESHCELIRQINLERKKIIQTKEKEMIVGLVKRGMTENDAKIKAELTIDSIINALKEGMCGSILQFITICKIKMIFKIFRHRKTGKFRISRFD